jgi:hypothetical protein
MEINPSSGYFGVWGRPIRTRPVRNLITEGPTFGQLAHSSGEHRMESAPGRANIAQQLRPSI